MEVSFVLVNEVKLLVTSSICGFLVVFLLTPTWTTYMPQAVLSKHKVVKLPTTFENQWKLIPKMLDEVSINVQLYIS